MAELSDDEAERLLEAFRAAGLGPAAIPRFPTPDRQSGVANGYRELGYPVPGPATPATSGNSSFAGSASRMPYSAGWDGAGDATDGAPVPAGHDGPAAPAGVWTPEAGAGSGDNGGGTTVSSVDFLADLGPSADARAVARVLSAATAPPWPHELRGYETARQAFENAGATPVRHAAGAGMPLRRLIGVKLAAVAGALTVTGVAVAAEADVLPSPIQRAAHHVLGGVGVPDPDNQTRTGQNMASSPAPTSGQPGSRGSQSPNRASGDPSSGGAVLPGTPVGSSDGSAPSSSASAAADALALCRAYTAHQGGDGGANGDSGGNGTGGLSEQDRKRLAALAGGADKIDDFCQRVLAAASTSPSAPQPTGASSVPSESKSGSATPSPSHDHKPDTSTPSSSSTFGPADSSSTGGNGNGHSHTPNPSRTNH